MSSEASPAITFNASRTTRSRMHGRFARARSAPAAATAFAVKGRSGGDGRLAALARKQPPAAVGAHVLDQRDQGAALLGERVLDPRRHLRVGPPLDDAVVLQRAQPEREGARADALERSLELTEPLAALGQVADQEERPLAGDDLRTASDWTGILGHFRLRDRH